MKKTSEKLLQQKRERKRLKRLRQNKSFIGENSKTSKLENFLKKGDERLISKHSFDLDNFINSLVDMSKIKPILDVKIPKTFSLEYNYIKSLETIGTIRKTLITNIGKEITLDFTKCKKVDFSILFLLKVLVEEYLSSLAKLDRKLRYFTSKPKIQIIHSKTERVNLKLLANEIILKISPIKSQFVPISNLRLIKGRKPQKHYSENKKGSTITKIREYINIGCLERHHLTLTSDGKSNIDGLLSEILNNSEDHSLFDTWYVFSNLFEINQKGTEKVSELNLAILNFGYSIYDGFEQSKDENHVVYNEMNELYNYIVENYGNQFSKENLFSLYALQEGKSRLKYKEQSRGTGTMKFINSFLNLGDYEDKKNNYIPKLHIYSGNTFIKCDNDYKPFQVEGVNYLSLNKENDLLIPPEKTHLKGLNRKFPGTLLVVKLYINENHLLKKMNNNDK